MADNTEKHLKVHIQTSAQYASRRTEGIGGKTLLRCIVKQKEEHTQRSKPHFQGLQPS